MEGDAKAVKGTNVVTGISIHSLRVEGDLAQMWDVPWDTISIHSLRVEGDRDMWAVS